MARQRIECVTLLVQDYDEAISYFSEKLGFQVVENRDLGGGKRWVLVAPPGLHGTRLLLAKAVSANQTSRVGDQTGLLRCMSPNVARFRRPRRCAKSSAIRGYTCRDGNVVAKAALDPTRKSSERWVVKGLSHPLSDPRQR